MPDLTAKEAHDYWRNYDDPMIYRVLTFMEGVETWTLDGDPNFEQAMTKFGEVLDDLGNVDLAKEDEIIKICAYVSANRFLRLLQCMDIANPGAASKIIMHAEDASESDSESASLFLRRNVVFERLRLLGRVFASERLALINKALEDEDHA